jgi:hypothetical protein
MHTLDNRDSGCVVINGIPYKKGELEVTPADYKNQLLTIWVRRNGPSNPILQLSAYTDLQLDGVAAATWSDVDTWVQTYMYDNSVAGGQTSNAWSFSNENFSI